MQVVLDVDTVKRTAVSLGIDSVSELARRSGIDRAHLSRVMRGQRPAKPSHLLALAEALNCKPEDLMLEKSA